MQKVVVSDPETGRAYNIELNEEKAKIFIGKRIGDTVDASPIGLKGYELLITGGSDKDGFPMRKDIHGRVRKRVLLSSPPGYRPKRKGVRRRKTVRGNEITPEIVQINTKIVKKGKKSIEELLGLGGEEAG
ncbi:MAG: 30S ribosomal protein S6e [Candidatus Hydrothermarchaeota archaeon]|nr:MAG: 30S ribosomal protein S6e [Candidatus Hydrothermarchaeota archaeon]